MGCAVDRIGVLCSQLDSLLRDGDRTQSFILRAFELALEFREIFARTRVLVVEVNFFFLVLFQHFAVSLLDRMIERQWLLDYRYRRISKVGEYFR